MVTPAPQPGARPPVVAAWRWLRAAREGRYLEAWRHLDADYRARLARGWVEYNAPRLGLRSAEVDAFADDFAQVVSGHEAWPLFVELQLDGAADPALEHLGWSSRARPLPFDHELVLLFDHGQELGPQGSAVPAHRFYMRASGDGWIVAGVDEEPPGLSGQPG